MRLSSGMSHVVVVVFGVILGIIVYAFFSGEGSYQFLFMNINRQALAQCLGFLSFGFYSRWCYELPIQPNEQGIQLFLGAQTGEVWGESNFLFIPRPFWSIWKRVSIQHFSFTVAAQNRTEEGHSLIVFATGRAVPNNVQLLAKISQEGIQEQLLGLSTMCLGAYIRNNQRTSLLNYQHLDISEYVKKVLGEHQLYGLDVTVFTSKVIEVNPAVMRQFDVSALQDDMQTTLWKLKQNFPQISDVELYAVYASIVGYTPPVMSYIVHGERNNTLLLGGGGIN